MTIRGFEFPTPELPPGIEALRADVRGFLEAEFAAGSWAPQSNFMAGFSAEFSQKLGARGWLGMTWPSRYGGHECSALERYVVTEELLAAGAPVSAHWVADRQSGPLLLRYGSEAQRQAILPRIAAGTCYFSIGMSEPDSGSDLASIRCQAKPADDGWIITGAKVWTSNAHRNHFMIALCRTGPAGDDRHGGLSQFLIDFKADDVAINPIYNLLGNHEFNEVVFDELLVAGDRLIGREGEDWQQVTSELALERSGPERFLSTFRLLVELVRACGPEPDRRAAEAIGRLTAHLVTLRRMSLSIAGMLEAGEMPNVEAAIVKDVGTRFEREVAEVARLVAPVEPARGAPGNEPNYAAVLAESILHLPSYTLRAGTTEIMRSIIARGLGLR